MGHVQPEFCLFQAHDVNQCDIGLMGFPHELPGVPFSLMEDVHEDFDDEDGDRNRIIVDKNLVHRSQAVSRLGHGFEGRRFHAYIILRHADESIFCYIL